MFAHDQRERLRRADGRRRRRRGSGELGGRASSLGESRRDGHARPSDGPLAPVAAVRPRAAPEGIYAGAVTRGPAERATELRVNPGVRREGDRNGEPARQTLEFAARHVRLEKGAPLERDETLFGRRHANLHDGDVYIRVVPCARDREVVPREPAPKRDVP